MVSIWNLKIVVVLIGNYIVIVMYNSFWESFLNVLYLWECKMFENENDDFS